MAIAPLLSANDLSKAFGVKPLFDGITLTVGEDERIALIGPNGSGKSTLLRMLAGLEDPDRGAVKPRNGLNIAFVAQEDRFDEAATVEEILIKELEKAGHHEHDVSGTVSMSLGRAGFHDRSRPVSALSGGWRKRLALARGFALQPELLLLDEPTNHLDIEGVLWLEEMLENASFALLFVSHDRYFIERLAGRVIELDRKYPNGFYSGNGSYADFLEARADYLLGLKQTQESLANKVRREVQWLRRGAKARTTKSKYRIERAGEMAEDLKNIDLRERQAEMVFSASKRKSKDLIKVEHIAKSFGDLALFKDVTLTLSPGVRLGVVGANGSGKTTFIRTLLGDLEPDSGTVTRAPNLRVAFFDQARRQLNPAMTLKQALCQDGDSVVFNDRLIHVVGWATRFLFRADQLLLPLASLSGGEQARVLLARMMLEPADILLFDEPTNDLDIATLEVLEESFLEFPGAIVLVTHDRYLLDRSSTTVLGIAGHDTALYGDYLQWELTRSTRARSRPEKEPRKDEDTSTSNVPPRALDARPVKLTYKEQRELDSMEAAILRAESETLATQTELNRGETAGDAKRLRDLCEKLAEQQKAVDALYTRWTELETKRKAVKGV